MMRVFLFLLISTFCASCVFTKSNTIDSKITGTYKNTLGKEWGSTSVLILKEDHSFSFRYSEEMIDQSTEGTWVLDKKNLVLNSVAIENYNGYVQEYHKNIDEGYSEIECVDWSDKPFSGIKVLVNDQQFITDSSGRIKIPFTIRKIYSNFFIIIIFTTW